MSPVPFNPISPICAPAPDSSAHTYGHLGMCPRTQHCVAARLPRAALGLRSPAGEEGTYTQHPNNTQDNHAHKTHLAQGAHLALEFWRKGAATEATAEHRLAPIDRHERFPAQRQKHVRPHLRVKTHLHS